LLDHVDCFPSQPKWTYRLETSVLDVKIPVAAPVSKPPLHRPSSLFLSSSRSANFLPFLHVRGARARLLVRVRRKRCNKGEVGEGGHGPANPKSPFPRYKASSLFSASILHIARLRAATLCERSIGATDKTES
jgi:hypothetical protein